MTDHWQTGVLGLAPLAPTTDELGELAPLFGSGHLIPLVVSNRRTA
jgi:hypothetical protein